MTQIRIKNNNPAHQIVFCIEHGMFCTIYWQCVFIVLVFLICQSFSNYCRSSVDIVVSFIICFIERLHLFY